MGHEHCDHGLGHVHAPRNFGLAFGVGVLLNGGFVVAEIVYGLRSGSLALLADAGHNGGDVLGLLAAWAASRLVLRTPTSRHTYGYRRSPILAALLNACLLLVATGAIIWEAVRRLVEPGSVQAGIVMWVAGIGIAINLATALMFMSGRNEDLNIEGSFLHMMGDAAVAAGVLVAGYVISLTHLRWIDPVVSILVAGVVLWASWRLLRQALDMAMDAVPEEVNPAAVRAYLEQLSGVETIHDLHIWSMSTTETALTVHLVCPSGSDDAFLSGLCDELHDKFGIEHATVQIERGDGPAPCRLASDEAV